MARIDDSSRVFDISRPHRVSPTATSKPVIVGHHPMIKDPMVTGDNSFSSHSEKKITPVHVTTEEDRYDSPSPPFNRPNPPENHALVTPKKETTEAPAEPPVEHHYTPVESLVGHEPEKPPDYHRGSYGAGHGGINHTEALPLPHPRGAGPKSPIKKILTWGVTLITLVVVGGYLAIDAGLVSANIKLPFEIFKDNKPAQGQSNTTVSPPAVITPTPAAPTLPAGFTAYKLPETSIGFAYPAEWGAPALTKEPGFTKRGGALKSDGTYAYLINFAANKDVQVAVSSNKYLPAKRTPLYYDFLQWCVGTNDGKFYKQLLRSATAAGIDTPTTITCDQGPLADAVKLDDLTISQPKTKGADNKDLGDIYTKNLRDKELVVLRVKDATMKNADNIKKFLGTVESASAAP